MNLTEPQAGSDVGALRSARRAGRRRHVARSAGTKIFISFGDHDMADNIVHLVLARTPGAPAGTRGISLFLVPKYRLDADGKPGEFNDVRVVSIEHKMGLHASPTCVLSFGDNGDCIGELIGAENGGHARDVHDDEQCAAQRRPAGRAGRRGRDAEGGRLCPRAHPVGARRVGRQDARSRSSSIPTSAAC